MHLGTRIALAMSGLVAATAAASSVGALNIASDRLNAEIRRSIEIVATPISTSIDEARRTCGMTVFADGNIVKSDKATARKPANQSPSESTDQDDRPLPVRKVPRELFVQCLDTTGALLASSPTKTLPIDDKTKVLAMEGGQRQELTTTIGDERVLIVAVPVKGFGVVQVGRQVNERDRVIASLVRRNLLIAGIATASAALIAAFLASRISRPVRRLTSATEAIGESGDLTGVAIANTGRKDEIGRLSNSFASMVASLRESKEAQARLVQDAGHELRTPLTSLRMNVSLLGRENLTAEKRTAIQADIEAELRELTLVTNELVSLAADTHKTEQPHPIDLVHLIDTNTQRWRRRSRREIALSVDKQLAHRTVTIGENAAQRIIDNLISNAIKFSPESAPIEIEVGLRNGMFQLKVSDRGPGIPLADHPRIFDRFYRTDSARAVTGSGLGLSIVKDLVTAANGEVSVTKRDGLGSIFTVRLPVNA